MNILLLISIQFQRTIKTNKLANDWLNAIDRNCLLKTFPNGCHYSISQAKLNILTYYLPKQIKRK